MSTGVKASSPSHLNLNLHSLIFLLGLGPQDQHWQAPRRRRDFTHNCSSREVVVVVPLSRIMVGCLRLEVRYVCEVLVLDHAGGEVVAELINLSSDVSEEGVA